jgi:hypothetical protein
MNFANHLLNADGSVNISHLMKAAHAKAKASKIGFPSWSYARHFQEAIQWAWDRARQMQRMERAA